MKAEEEKFERIIEKVVTKFLRQGYTRTVRDESSKLRGNLVTNTLMQKYLF